VQAQHIGARAGNRTLNLGIKRLPTDRLRASQGRPGRLSRIRVLTQSSQRVSRCLSASPGEAVNEAVKSPPVCRCGRLYGLAVLVGDARSREENHPGHESCGQCNLDDTPESNRRRGRPAYPDWARACLNKVVGCGAPSYSHSPEAAKKIEVEGAKRFGRRKAPNATGHQEQSDCRGVPEAKGESPVGIPPHH
jgi:hypothetical protein